jgi:hypothetical protein
MTLNSWRGLFRAIGGKSDSMGWNGIMTLDDARKIVANDWRDLAAAILSEDDYAPHVSQDEKLRQYEKHMAFANDIESGVARGFTVSQRIHFAMTGDCIPLLS